MVMIVLDWSATIIQGPLAIITAGATVALCISLVRFSQSVERISRKQLIASSTLSNVCYSIAAILYFIEDISLMADESTSNPGKLCYFGKFASFWHFFARTTMILVFTIRIENTFKRSSMEYGACVMRTLYAAAICLAFLYVFLVVLVIFNHFLIAFIFTVCWIFFYVVLSMVLVYLFIRKLDMVMTETAVNKSQEISKQSLSSINRAAIAAHAAAESSTQQNGSTEASDVPPLPAVIRSSSIKRMIEGQFLVVVTKHALLVPLAVCSSFVLVSISFGIAYKIGQDVVCFGPFASMWESLDCTISSMCNYLLFGCNASVYNLLCWRFHQLCEKCKVRQMKRNVNQKLDTVRAASIRQANLSMKRLPSPKLKDAKSLSLVKHDSNAVQMTTTTKALPKTDLS